MHLELLPILVCLDRLGPLFKGRRILIFVDLSITTVLEMRK